MPVLAEEATSSAMLSQAGLAKALWHSDSSLFYPILLLLTDSTCASVQACATRLLDSGSPPSDKCGPTSSRGLLPHPQKRMLKVSETGELPFASQSSYSRNTAHTGS